jgi:ribosomal protein L11 methylase PrmA
MNIEPSTEFKSRQRETWTLGDFGDMTVFTTPVAAHLVCFTGVTKGHAVLDVGTGTGVVAITALNVDAKVIALDLTPALLAQAGESATLGEMRWMN